MVKYIVYWQSSNMWHLQAMLVTAMKYDLLDGDDVGVVRTQNDLNKVGRHGICISIVIGYIETATIEKITVDHGFVDESVRYPID